MVLSVLGVVPAGAAAAGVGLLGPWRGAKRTRTPAVGVAAFAIVFGGSANKHRKLFSASMTLSLVCVSILFASCGGTKPQPAANAGPRRTYVIQVKAAGVDTSTGRQIANSLSLNLTL